MAGTGKTPGTGPLPQAPLVPGTQVVRAQARGPRQEPAAGRPGGRAALRRHPAATARKAARAQPTVAMAARSHVVAVRRRAAAVRSHAVAAAGIMAVLSHAAAVVGPSAGTTREAPQALSPAAADQAWEAPPHGQHPQEGEAAEGEEDKQ
jgi:hypothetical protein